MTSLFQFATHFTPIRALHPSPGHSMHEHTTHIYLASLCRVADISGALHALWVCVCMFGACCAECLTNHIMCKHRQRSEKVQIQLLQHISDDGGYRETLIGRGRLSYIVAVILFAFIIVRAHTTFCRLYYTSVCRVYPSSIY